MLMIWMTGLAVVFVMPESGSFEGFVLSESIVSTCQLEIKRWENLLCAADAIATMLLCRPS